MLYGRCKKSIECYDRAIEANSNDADAFNYKGLALHCLGKYQKAIECYDESIEINLRHASAWYNKSFALCGLGKLEQARKCLDRAIELGPNPEPKSVKHMPNPKILPTRIRRIHY